MIHYTITKSLQTSIWKLVQIGTIIDSPKAHSGSPNGGNVQALVDLIPKDKVFYLEVR